MTDLWGATLPTWFAAVGTVGTLIAAVRALRAQQREQARSDVRGFRCWLDVQKEKANIDSYGVTLRVQNATSEVMYDVKTQISDPAIRRFGNLGIYGRLEPGEDRELKFSVADSMGPLTSLEDNSGAEAIFNDSRGHRWHIDSRGRPRIIAPLRRLTPWRTRHPLDRETLHWWALRENWVNRWEDLNWWGLEYPLPRWYAIDIRWKGWRYARSKYPVQFPWWAWLRRWRDRDEIARGRYQAKLPVPLWAIDKRWKVWRLYRLEFHKARRNLKRQNADYMHYRRTGVYPKDDDPTGR